MEDQATTKAEKRLRNSIMNEIPLYKRGFEFRRLRNFKIQKYSKKRPNLVLITINHSTAISYRLVDFQNKKVIKSHSINLREIIGGKDMKLRLKELLQESFKEDYFRINTLSDFIYLPVDQSLIIKVVICQISFKVKINQFLTYQHPTIFPLQRLDEIPFRSADTMKLFGDDRIFCKKNKSTPNQIPFRPLAWLDPETFEQKAFEGLEGHPRSRSLYIGDQNESPRPFPGKLSDSHILISNNLSAFVYDFEQGELVAELRHSIGRSTQSGLNHYKREGSVYVSGFGGLINLLKVDKTTKKVRKFQSVNVPDMFENIAPGFASFEFNFFEMVNGNYLYVGKQYFSQLDRGEGGGGENNPQRKARPDLVGIEFDRQNLEVVGVKVGVMDAIESEVYVEQIYKASGMFVLNGDIREAESGETVKNGLANQSLFYRLILLNSDFEIIDYCKKSELRKSFAIRAVSQNRVISVGQENQLYLHEINAGEGVLSRLKTVKLEGGSIILNKIKEIHASSVILRVKKVERDEEGEISQKVLIMKFGSNLELEFVTKGSGFYKNNLIYPLQGSKFAYKIMSSMNFGRFRNTIYVVDLEDKSIRLAYSPSHRFEQPVFSWGETSDKADIWVIHSEEIWELSLSE